MMIYECKNVWIGENLAEIIQQCIDRGVLEIYLNTPIDDSIYDNTEALQKFITDIEVAKLMNTDELLYGLLNIQEQWDDSGQYSFITNPPSRDENLIVVMLHEKDGSNYEKD
jgi:hypothetical protein